MRHVVPAAPVACLIEIARLPRCAVGVTGHKIKTAEVVFVRRSMQRGASARAFVRPSHPLNLFSSSCSVRCSIERKVEDCDALSGIAALRLECASKGRYATPRHPHHGAAWQNATRET